MVQSTEGRNKNRRGPARTADLREELPYSIEMWGDAPTGVGRIIARAQNASLARAIFKAACEENPERRLTLRHGNRILAA